MEVPEEIHEDKNQCLSNPRRNNLIFSIIVICLQVVMSVIYGKYIISAHSYINVGSVLTTIFVALLAIAGFGLYFSYLQRLVWSSLGFNLLITAFCIQLYPLINAFWIKCKIYQSLLYPDSFGVPTYNLYLANLTGQQNKGNTITGSIRCALSLIIAFASIIGRAGALECLFLIVVGTVGFQLNREIIMGIGQDFFGTFSIFTFGSFLGLTVAVFLTIRDKRISGVRYEGKLVGQVQTVIYSLFGGLLIFTLLPVLAHEGDNSNTISIFNLLNGPLSIILAMGSAVITSISCFSFKYGLEGGLRVKDILNGVIAGGIVCGSASYYITTPVLALICGSAAAIVQFIFQHFIQQRILNKIGLVTTYSFSLFGLQGFVGAIFAAGYNNRVANNNNSNNFSYVNALTSPGSEFSIYFISAGMGLASGIIIGLFAFCFSNYKKNQIMHDKKEWTSNDGIKYHIQKTRDEIKDPMQFFNNERTPGAGPSTINLPTTQRLVVGYQQQSQSLEFDIADFLQVAME